MYSFMCYFSRVEHMAIAWPFMCYFSKLEHMAITKRALSTKLEHIAFTKRAVSTKLEHIAYFRQRTRTQSKTNFSSKQGRHVSDENGVFWIPTQHQTLTTVDGSDITVCLFP